MTGEPGPPTAGAEATVRAYLDDAGIEWVLGGRPGEFGEAFYRHLLRRNLRMPGLAYAVDTSGDVYVKGEVPTAAVDAAYLDQLFGVVLEAADSPFNELLVLGFLTSMRKEWAWRISRGESTRNLEAFRHLLEDQPGQ